MINEWIHKSKGFHLRINLTFCVNFLLLRFKHRASRQIIFHFNSLCFKTVMKVNFCKQLYFYFIFCSRELC